MDYNWKMTIYGHFFDIIYTFLGSNFDPCYIQNRVIMNCVIQRLKCTMYVIIWYSWWRWWFGVLRPFQHLLNHIKMTEWWYSWSNRNGKLQFLFILFIQNMEWSVVNVYNLTTQTSKILTLHYAFAFISNTVVTEHIPHYHCTKGILILTH